MNALLVDRTSCHNITINAACELHVINANHLGDGSRGRAQLYCRCRPESAELCSYSYSDWWALTTMICDACKSSPVD
eukprot:scaffold807_cov49-Prasinocladus_malaysianus.AAC.1